MTELENGIVITHESNNYAQFDRDNCYVILNLNLSDKEIFVQFFYCTGSSSSDGSNQQLRGSGKGKKLLLDSLIYIQQKHSQLVDSQLVDVGIFPVPSFDPEKIEKIYKIEIDRYIASNEEMRTSFEEEVMYSSDYQEWAKRYDDLDRDAKEKIAQYKTEQGQKLINYYKSLGFTGTEDGPTLHGNLSNIINTISDSTARGSRKDKKNKKSRKDKKKKSRKDKKNKSRKDKKNKSRKDKKK